VTEVLEQQREETAPVTAQLPADVAAPADDELTQLLQEFDTATSKPADPAADQEPTAPDLDQQINELLGPDPKVAELQGQLNTLQGQMRQQQELAEFNSFADDLQKQVAAVAPHVQDDWVRLKLESYGHDPVARLAWETRHIPAQDAARDLAHVRAWLHASPDADPKQIQEAKTLAYQLEVAANSAGILRQAKNQILSDARKLPLPLDPIATADRDAIAQAIRDGSTPIIPEMPVRWGSLSAKEGREKVLRDFGFDPGWGH
jgi:hypothetical protein